MYKLLINCMINVDYNNIAIVLFVNISKAYIINAYTVVPANMLATL